MLAVSNSNQCRSQLFSSNKFYQPKSAYQISCFVFGIESIISESAHSDLLPEDERKIFQTTPLIGRLLTLFQDIDPELSISSTIWKVISLAAYLRHSDQQELILCMRGDGNNKKFLETLAKLYINQNLSPNGFECLPDPPEPPASVTIPDLNRIFTIKRTLPQDFENEGNLDGKDYS